MPRLLESGDAAPNIRNQRVTGRREARSQIILGREADFQVKVFKSELEIIGNLLRLE